MFPELEFAEFANYIFQQDYIFQFINCIFCTAINIYFYFKRKYWFKWIESNKDETVDIFVACYIADNGEIDQGQGHAKQQWSH